MILIWPMDTKTHGERVSGTVHEENKPLHMSAMQSDILACTGFAKKIYSRSNIVHGRHEDGSWRCKVRDSVYAEGIEVAGLTMMLPSGPF